MFIDNNMVLLVRTHGDYHLRRTGHTIPPAMHLRRTAHTIPPAAQAMFIHKRFTVEAFPGPMLQFRASSQKINMTGVDVLFSQSWYLLGVKNT